MEKTSYKLVDSAESSSGVGERDDKAERDTIGNEENEVDILMMQL